MDDIDDTRTFYDLLASYQDHFKKNWQIDAHHQCQTLNRLFTQYSRKPVETILDCAAGIGTQSLGLTELGYNVVASDLSPKALETLQTNASARGIDIKTYVSDFRDIDKSVPLNEPLDCIIACDNALPHILDPRELGRAFKSFKECLNPHGMLLFSIRDYDSILQHRPRVTTPVHMSTNAQRCIHFQVWNWRDNKPIYDFEFIVLVSQGNGWTSHNFKASYRAYRRSELSELLRKNGFREHRWLFETGYHQPVLVAWPDHT